MSVGGAEAEVSLQDRLATVSPTAKRVNELGVDLELQKAESGGTNGVFLHVRVHPQSDPSPLPMVFNLTSPPFSPSPSVASPVACNGCIGVISRFDESQPRGRLEDRGAVGETPDEDSGGRNSSTGKANRLAKKQVKEVSLLGKAVEVLDAIGGSVTNLNMNNSFISRSTIKVKIAILAFEVANTITKGANLMQSLTEQNIVYLKEEVLPSKVVQYLVSTDMDELLRIAAADQRKELQLFTKEVVRLGNLCKDHQFHNLDLYFDKMESITASKTPLRKDTWAVMLPLMNLVQLTAELYHELHALDRFEEYQHKLQEHISLDAKDKDESLPILRSEVRRQRRHLKSLKKKSLWSRTLDEVVGKLVDIINCLELELLKAFGFEREAGGSASNGSKLGSSGMALHYAIIITLIDNIVAHSGSVPPTMTNALYQSLPPGIKSALRFWLRQGQIQEEPTIPTITAKMEKTLSWLAPVAANTIKAHYGFARPGEWPNVRSKVNQRRSGKDDFVRFNTLYHADKEKTDPYIVELLFWLHQLVSKRRAINNGVTCSLGPMVSSLSDEEIRLSSHSLLNDEDKRELMPRTRETLESETETPYSCHYHLPCTGICDSPTNRSLGVSVPILKILSMDFGIDMMTALDVIDGIAEP